MVCHPAAIMTSPPCCDAAPFSRPDADPTLYRDAGATPRRGVGSPPCRYRPSEAHHRHEALFVRALLCGAYDRAAAELRTAIFLRRLVGSVYHGGLDAGHALFVRHLEGELARLLGLAEASRPHSYRVSSGIYNSVKRLMHVPRRIRR